MRARIVRPTVGKALIVLSLVLISSFIFVSNSSAVGTIITVHAVGTVDEEGQPLRNIEVTAQLNNASGVFTGTVVEEFAAYPIIGWPAFVYAMLWPAKDAKGETALLTNAGGEISGTQTWNSVEGDHAVLSMTNTQTSPTEVEVQAALVVTSVSVETLGVATWTGTGRLESLGPGVVSVSGCLLINSPDGSLSATKEQVLVLDNAPGKIVEPHVMNYSGRFDATNNTFSGSILPIPAIVDSDNSGVADNCEASVGGVAELPGADAEPLEALDSSGPRWGVLAGIAAALLASVILLGGAAWKAKGRFSRS